MQNYSPEVQSIFISFMLADASLYTRVQNIYNSENFDKSIRKAAKFIREHTDNYATLPDRAQILAVTGCKFEQIDEINNGHIDLFLNEFEQFPRHEELKRAILKSADLLETGDFGPVEKMIKDAVKISL